MGYTVTLYLVVWLQFWFTFNIQDLPVTVAGLWPLQECRVRRDLLLVWLLPQSQSNAKGLATVQRTRRPCQVFGKQIKNGAASTAQRLMVAFCDLCWAVHVPAWQEGHLALSQQEPLTSSLAPRPNPVIACFILFFFFPPKQRKLFFYFLYIILISRLLACKALRCNRILLPVQMIHFS